jgi:hypothetical protein
MEICFAFNIISLIDFLPPPPVDMQFIGKNQLSCLVYLMVLPWFVMGQLPFSNGSPEISTSNENYLVGNLSQSFTFQVAPPSIKVTYLGLNGFSLYITGVGFSNKSKFNYDEHNNRLTILSLDLNTVGYYTAVDTNWKTFTNIISAINGKS